LGYVTGNHYPKEMHRFVYIPHRVTSYDPKNSVFLQWKEMCAISTKVQNMHTKSIGIINAQLSRVPGWGWYVMYTDTGERVTNNWKQLAPWGIQFFHVWKPALKETGLEPRSLYQTRHTFATLMLDAGNLSGWAQKMTGHESLQMIHDEHYSPIKTTTGRKRVPSWRRSSIHRSMWTRKRNKRLPIIFKTRPKPDPNNDGELDRISNSPSSLRKHLIFWCRSRDLNPDRRTPTRPWT